MNAEMLARWVAYHLPRRVVYWAAIRLGAYATTGQWSATVVPEVTFMEALERWRPNGRETRAWWRDNAMGDLNGPSRRNDGYARYLLALDDALDTAEQKCDRFAEMLAYERKMVRSMRPVVEAAVKWLKWRHLPESEWNGATESLEDVIDAYEAAQGGSDGR